MRIRGANFGITTVVLSLVCTTQINSFSFERQRQLRPHSFGSSRVLLSAASPTATSLPSSSSTPPKSAGFAKTIIVPGKGDVLRVGEIATVKYSCCVIPNEDDNDNILAPFCKSSRQKVIVGDNTMIDGWEQAIRSMRVNERSLIRITDPTLAYGAVGIPPVVPPNAVIEIDLEILSSQPVGVASQNIDLTSLIELSDASTPTTATEIAAAYQKRQDAKAPPKEGLEYWIDKVRQFYFFGLFEGESGERPPWFLRPSITFPLAFLIVGATFYLSILGGGIYERGSQATDELDDIILSRLDGGSDPSLSGILLALNAMSMLFTTSQLGM